MPNPSVMKFFNKLFSLKWTSFVPVILVLLTAWVAVNTSFNKDYKTGKLEADARGYYAYLPAVFIYHDLGFGFINDIEFVKYNNPSKFYKYYNTHEGKVFDKYYLGTALMLSPFFLAGHILTLATGQPADGYSYFYTMMVHVGALFYLFIGILGLRKLLRMYNFSEANIGWTLSFILLGTNLFYYAITEFAMSHLYSFVAITWFCVAIKTFFEQPHRSVLIPIAALLLALIALIRPVNAIIVLAIPFLAGSYMQLRAGIQNLFNNLRWLVLALVLFVSLVSLQFIVYRIGTGSFFMYSYKGEGFDFLHPHFIDFLFSYKKGFFVYTPTLFVALVGLIPLYRSNKFIFYSISAFLLVLVYVLSSWEMWYYGGSFSQRVMIDFYALFAILMATLLQNIKNTGIKKWVLTFFILLLLVNQVQTYQYRRAIIHWSDMTKERYWEVFLRVDKLL